jgi:hypothetical protein
MTRFYKGKKSQEKSFAENSDCNFFIARDFTYGENIPSKEYSAFKTIDDFFEFEKNLTQKCCYETLKDQLIEIYDIDGDYSKPTYQNSKGEPATDEEIVQEFIDARLDFQSEKYPDIPLSYNNFLIKKTDDPNGKKISFHFIIRNGYKFNDITHLKKHAKDFQIYCNGIYKVRIDEAIYSRNRQIRMLGHHKIGQEQRFSYRYKNHTIYNEICPRKMFFSSFLEGNEKLYPIFEKVETDDDKETREMIDKIQLDSIKPTDETVKTLVELILQNVDNEESLLCDSEIKNKINYGHWWKFVTTIFRCCESEFTSKILYKIVFDYYRHNENIGYDKYYNDIYKAKDEYTQLTINSLHFLARQNKKYKEIFEKEIKEFNEKLSLLKYEKNLSRALKLEKEIGNNYPISYISEIPMLYNLSKKYPYTLKYIEGQVNNVICNISNGGDNSIFCKDKYFCPNSKATIELYKQNKFSKLSQASGFLNIQIRYINQNYLRDLKIYNDAGGPNSKLVPPEQYIITKLAGGVNPRSFPVVEKMMMTNQLKTYSRPVFIPHLYSNDKILSNYKDCLNLFLGFPYTINNTVSPELYKNSLLRENLRKYLCNGDEEPENFTFIEKHTAHLIQKPYERCDMAIIMTGSQGTGKDLWCTHLSKMIGLEYFLDISSMSLLFKDFNSTHGRKLLVKLNEISDKGEHFDKHNQLKEKITATRIRIEPKGFDAYYLENYARYYGFSQHDNIVMVENTDRRFMMIKTNNEKANDQEYFSKILKESEDPLMIQSSFNYYANLDITDFNPRVFPNTNYRDDQKIQSLPYQFKFFYYLFENHTEQTYIRLISDVFTDYLSWCCECNIKISNTKINFTKDIKRLGIEVKRIQVSGKRGLGISINHSSLENVFKKYMKNPNFILPKQE